MSNDVINLVEKNGEKLRNIYLQQLAKIKKLIIDATVRREDTDDLNRLRKKLEKAIRELERRLNECAEALINESQLEANKRTDDIMRNAFFPLLAALPDIRIKDSGAVLAEAAQKSIKQVKLQINKSAGNFLNADFTNPRNIAGKLRRLTGLKVPPRLLGAEHVKELQKTLERDLRRRELFKIAYKNKSGDVVRHVSVETYTRMLANTIIAEAYRTEMKDFVLSQFAAVGDLVEVVGTPLCECDVCAKYYGQILSLTGATKGYTTLDEAREEGLFHPNCRHYYTVTNKVFEIYKNNQSKK